MIRRLFKWLHGLLAEHYTWEQYTRSAPSHLDLKCSCGGSASIVLEQKCGCPIDRQPIGWCGHMPEMTVLSATCHSFRRFAKRHGQPLAPIPKATARLNL